MIFDGFTFFNELDILKIRFEELYPVVDKFIIVESPVTFRGEPKPLYFLEQIMHFHSYRDKIVHIVKEFTDAEEREIQRLDHAHRPWARERMQRNAMSWGFGELNDKNHDDILLISDVDEIPRRDVIANINPAPIMSVNMNMYYYAMNVYAEQWGALRAVRRSHFTTAEEIRHTPVNKWADGGWHFSYLGDINTIITKFRSFSHWELDNEINTNPEVIKKRMENLEDLWGHGHTYTKVDVDDTYPEAVKNNMEYYSKYMI